MSEIKNVWITTPDNPFDPFTQFDRWFQFDFNNGYRTCERLSKLAHCSLNNLTDSENRIEIERAIGVLCADLYEPYQVYIPVVEGQTVPWR